MSTLSETKNENVVKHELPAEPGMWLFILGDMLIFGVIFLGFVWYRNQNPDVFLAGQSTLNQTLGFVNTLLLLISSWFIALGERALKIGKWKQTPYFMGLGILCAVGFCIIKYFEYSAKVTQGLTPQTDVFYSFYYVATGIHLLHVVVAIGLLGGLMAIRLIVNTPPNDDAKIAYEAGAIFWHLVDLLWIFLFAIIYMMV